MRKDPIDLYEEEDQTRLMAEQANERLRLQLEMQRTLLSVDRKNAAIEDIRVIMKDLVSQVQQLQQHAPFTYLLNLSKRLIDNDELQVATTRNARSYGFVELKSLYDEYWAVRNLANRQVVENPQNTPWLDKDLRTFILALIAQIALKDPERAQALAEYNATINDFRRRSRLFIFLLYHRDYLNNKRYDGDDKETISLKNSLLLKMIYTLPTTVGNIMGERQLIILSDCVTSLVSSTQRRTSPFERQRSGSNGDGGRRSGSRGEMTRWATSSKSHRVSKRSKRTRNTRIATHPPNACYWKNTSRWVIWQTMEALP